MSVYPVPPKGPAGASGTHYHINVATGANGVSIAQAPSYVAPSMDIMREWQIYQNGTRNPVFTVEIFDGDIASMMKSDKYLLVVSAPHLPPLREFDKTYLWNAAMNRLVYVSCEWDSAGASYIFQMKMTYTRETLPHAARQFNLDELLATPEFKDGQEALDWMEDQI